MNKELDAINKTLEDKWAVKCYKGGLEDDDLVSV